MQECKSQSGCLGNSCRGCERRRRRAVASTGDGRVERGASAPRRRRPGAADTHLGQLAELVGVQQQLLQAARVTVDLLGDVDERAVAPVDGLHMTVATPQGHAVEHRRAPAEPSRRDPGSEPAQPGSDAPPSARSAVVGWRVGSQLAATLAAQDSPGNLERSCRRSAPLPRPPAAESPSRRRRLREDAGSFRLAAPLRLRAEGGSSPGAMLGSGFSRRPGSGEALETCGRAELALRRSMLCLDVEELRTPGQARHLERPCCK